MIKTIEYLKPKARTWDQNPAVCFVDGGFTDGEEFTAAVGRDLVEQAMESLRNLVGKEADLELADPRTWNGVTTWKLRNWPGKPKPAGSSGFRARAGMLTDAHAAAVAAAVWAHGRALADAIEAYAVFLDLIRGAGPRSSGTEALAETDEAPPAPETSPPAASPPPTSEPAGGITFAQIRALRRIAWQRGMTEEEALAQAGVTDWAELSAEQAGDLIERWQS